MKTQHLQVIMDFLLNNPVQIISTVREVEPNGVIPVSRPFGSAILYNDKIWYCMNSNKPTFSDLIDNPHICICACNIDRSWIRIYARANFVDDMEVKEMYIKRKIGSFSNSFDPLFKVFCLEDICAEIHKNGKISTIKI